MARRDVARDPHKVLDKESLQSFRASLGPVAARYSDAELVQLHADMRASARLLLDLYLLKKQGPEKATRGGLEKMRYIGNTPKLPKSGEIGKIIENLGGVGAQ